MQPPRQRNPGPLRVGILGCSLHFHPILSFIAPLVRGLDRQRFSVRVYSAGTLRDEYQNALRGLSDQWLDVAALETPQLVERLRAEELDVLIEVDNHTRDNRLAALAKRVAPVQISLLGLNQTTGLEAIDYRITDAVVDPPGTESGYTERLLRLPSCHLAYLPFGSFARVPPAPALHSTRVRIGVFNSWHKIDGAEIALWASLLRKIDRLQLVVAGFDDGVARLRLQRQLAAAGIAAERVELHPFLEQSRFWSLVQSVDLALDSYPWGGGATTAAVLSLGIPLLTRTGPRAASRIGASMLLALGMGDWVLPADADVAGRVAELAADPLRLDSLRRPLQDAFAARFCHTEAYEASMAELLERICTAQN
jgi:predicted O-linked N-acetylglucosamine transferase (SPINDLY family)